MIVRCAAYHCRRTLTDDDAIRCDHGTTFCDAELAEDVCESCSAEAECSIAQCFKPSRSKGGLCSMHEARKRRHGDPNHTKVVHNDEAGRFWPKVDRSGDCWLWTGALNNRGYGSFKSSAGNYAHRWAYASVNGPIPEGLVIDHLCRVTECVNPEHLEAVTQATNTRRGLRGFDLTGKCRRGHDITDPANVYEGPNYRTCRICQGGAA